MLGTAIALSIMTTIGEYILFTKLPVSIQRFIIEHELFTEVIVTVLTYILLGGTLTALIAGSLVGLQVSALLYIANHSEDFQYIEDIKLAIIDNLKKLAEWLKVLGQKYRESKLQLA